MKEINLKPIGFVKNNIKEQRFGGFADEVSEIIVEKKFTPIVGIFACRCPSRPNPIAITTVKLLEHNRNKIKVNGLDILDGTPVIDVKPYWPHYDKVENGKIPDWVNKLDL